MKAMVRAFRKINTKCRKRSQRGKGVKLIGIKCLECNFNPTKRTYNPHFHLIVPNKEVADLLVKEWRSIWTEKFTCKAAQFSEPLRDKKKSMVELIKYSAKTFVTPDQKPKDHKKTTPSIYASALDNIYAAMKGQRIFERFGFNLPKNSKKIGVPTRLTTSFKEYDFEPLLTDWIEKGGTGQLSGYKAPIGLINILETKLNSDLE